MYIHTHVFKDKELNGIIESNITHHRAGENQILLPSHVLRQKWIVMHPIHCKVTPDLFLAKFKHII